MTLDRFVRLSIAIVVALVFVVAIAALLFISESALNVWDRLREGPAFILYIYIGLMVLLAIAAVWLIFRLVVKKKAKPDKPGKPLTQADIKKRLREADAAGVDTHAAQAELQQLAARQASGAIHLCFFGEISTGKSSLIKALVPTADVLIDSVGGSTSAVRHYRWRNQAGHEILLTDVPGTGGHEEGLDDLAAEEAKRSHLVVFVCDSDLSRAELNAIKGLLAFDKPIVLVLNKADRYNEDERAMLLQKLMKRIEDIGGEIERDHVVAVTAGGETEVIKRQSDGSEGRVSVSRSADIGVLVVAINRLLSDNAAPLDVRRERAVFQIAADKLRAAENQYRAQRSEQIIRSSTRKAVIGAMAAVSPGTDILVQGYIGTTMTRELCELYGAAPRDLDIEEFLSLGQSRAGKALPLTMAVAGNGLKAFPGLGTVAGGLAHAVAYGLIFDALGRSLVLTLSRHGELVPETAAKEFEEGISEHLEAGVRRIAKMALDEKTS
jgi:GTP-binding protein EngB required for normal cell division